VSEACADTKSGAGRPRDPRVDEAIVAATLALLAEAGYAQLTVDEIASRAGVGKASLYRRWPDKVSIVLDAVSRNPQRPSAPDTGSLRDDALTLLLQLARYRTAYSEAIAAISGEALCNAAFAEAFRAGMTDPVVAGLRAIVRRAVDRGELPVGTDVELLASLPPSLLFMQRLLSGHCSDAAFAERIVDQFFSPGDETVVADPRRSSPGRARHAPESESP
jgi:AcrR family transcriptional regulator